MVATKTFKPEPRSVSAAREFVRDVLDESHHPHPDAILVTSELASNVVRHARTEYTVSVDVSDNYVEIGVSDGSSILPAVTDLALGLNGYGLRLLESTSSEWGVETLPQGKRVWARIDNGAPDAGD